MQKARRRSFSSRKRTEKITLLKRFIIIFGLVVVALLMAKPILAPLISQAGVLGEKIYLAKNTEEEQEKSEYEKQQEYKKNEQEYQKHQAEKQYEKDHENPKVICIGPDGKKFKTTKKECEKLSEMAGKEVEFEIIVTPLPTTSYDEETTSGTFTTDSVTENETEDQPQGTNSAPSAQNSNQASPVTVRAVPLPETPIEVQAKESGEIININTKEIKVTFEQEDGHIVVKAQQEDGTTFELTDDALFHIEERLAIDRIQIATTSANEFLIQRNNTAAVTNFPLSWDLTTNTLIITTPGGRKSVPVLPDVAVQNLIIARELDHATIPESLKKDRNVHLGTILDIATLTHQNGDPVYEITGIASQKLFGIFPVAIEKTVGVSGETGKVIGTSESTINRLIDLISF